MHFKSILLVLLVVLNLIIKSACEQIPERGVEAVSYSQPLLLCPCTLGPSCGQEFYIPMIDDMESRQWFIAGATNFTSVNEGPLGCKEGQIHLTLTEGSFALLPNGSLAHVHGKVVFPMSSYCFKRSFSVNDDYVYQDAVTHYISLEAEVCVTPPTMPVCCHADNYVTYINNTIACKPGHPPTLNTPVMFDGSSHKWLLDSEYQKFPQCDKELSVIPVGSVQGFGSLHYVSGELQFRWRPDDVPKIFTVDNSDFCVGQLDVFNSMKPVVAFCRQHYAFDEQCSSATCFGKCCPDEQVYDLDLNSCQTTSFMNTWKPDGKTDNRLVVHGMPSCEKYFLLSLDDFRLLANGSLFVKSWKEIVPFPNYCFDIFVNQTHMMPISLVCFQTTPYSVNASDISPVLYYILLLITSVILFVSMGIFLYRTWNACRADSATSNKGTTTLLDTQNQSGEVENDTKAASNDHCPGSTGSSPSLCQIGHFHILVCAFLVCSSIEAFLMAVQQAVFASLSTTLCAALGGASQVFGLSAVGHLWSLVVRHKLLTLHSYRTNRTLPRALTSVLYVAPWLVSILFVTCAHFTVPLQQCTLLAALIDPWGGYPITVAHCLLLVPCIVLLAWLAANGEAAIMAGGSLHNMALDSCRLWLLIKFCAILVGHHLLYLSVWSTDATAFWVFADVSLLLQSILVSACLLIHDVKCCKSLSTTTA